MNTKRRALPARHSYVRLILEAARRRQGWFLENLSARKASNMLLAGAQFLMGRETVSSWPVAVKIDISPLCNLRCTVCVHARANGNPDLERQSFDKSQRMVLSDFQKIIDEIKGRSTAVSLYYLGDPFVHPDVDEMCSIARAAALNVHVSSNFSFNFSDERLRSIVSSGLTHLTVCVDGIDQSTYERTRVGGRIDVVMSNLERLLRIRRECGSSSPRVEVQYLKFRHNVEQLPETIRRLEAMGIDQVSEVWGELGNYTDTNPDKYEVFGPKPAQLIPRCLWPYFFMVIKYNGDVIPCCNHRMGMQYRTDEDSRAVGNVFESSVGAVWNSARYRALRRLVARPWRARDENELNESFCSACPTVFDTNVAKHRVSGSSTDWEDVYRADARGRPVRIDPNAAPVAPEPSASLLMLPAGTRRSVRRLRVLTPETMPLDDIRRRAS